MAGERHVEMAPRLVWRAVLVVCFVLRPRLARAFVPPPYQLSGYSKASCPGVLRDGTSDLPSQAPYNPLGTVDERTYNWLIHWRGENVEGYSLSFRHDEFRSALLAVAREETTTITDDRLLIFPNVTFANALRLNSTTTTISNDDDDDSSTKDSSRQCPTSIKEEAYNQAMQYVSISTNDVGEPIEEDNDELKHAEVYRPTLDHLVRAARRCSLIHALYQIVASSDSMNYEVLADTALAGTYFDDMQDPVHKLSWCIRVRHYRSTQVALAGALPRYGHRARSVRRESEAVAALTPLLLTFAGPVHLERPDCKIYIFDGLIKPSPIISSNENKEVMFHNVLTRRVAQGVRTSILNPNTRRCVTNTPLCPTAACLMCNIGQVRRNSTVLDPYAGSGTILLAAALLVPSSRTVGIEIAHNGLVDRTKIGEDFRIRDNLTPPKALLQGDCTDPSIRREALAAINSGPFDCILTDPPYGIRESLLEKRPIDDLLDMIRDDRNAGRPLLRKHGRLVVYLPQSDDEPMTDVLPTAEKMEEAGLRLELARKQYLSDVLNRWLVSFVCLT
jgi:Putative RNA methylase family UPF0020